MMWPKPRQSFVICWMIVFMDLLANELVTTIIQDRYIGFFNDGDECIGSDDKSPQCKHAMSVTEQVNGYSALVSCIFAFVLSPLLGAVSDAYGRRGPMFLILLGSTFLPILALVLNTAFGVTLWIYIILRSFTNGFSTVSISFAYVADLTHGRDRTRQFGILMSGFSLGSIIGPIFATYTGISETGLFSTAAGISLTSFIISFFWLGESLSDELQMQKRATIAEDYRQKVVRQQQGTSLDAGLIEPVFAHPIHHGNKTVVVMAMDHDEVVDISDEEDEAQQRPRKAPMKQPSPAPSSAHSIQVGALEQPLLISTSSSDSSTSSSSPAPYRWTMLFANPLKAVLILNRNNLLRGLAIIIFIVVAVIFGTISILYLYLHGRFGMNQQEHAIMMVVSGSSGVLIQSVLLAVLLKFMTNKSLMVMGVFLLILSSIFYGLMWSQSLVFVIAPIGAFGMLCFPAITALKSNALGADEQGTIQGALSAVRSIGSGIGPFMFNQLLSSTQDTKWYGLPYYGGAAITLIALGIALWVKEIQHVDSQSTQLRWSQSTKQLNDGSKETTSDHPMSPSLLPTAAPSPTTPISDAWSTQKVVSNSFYSTTIPPTFTTTTAAPASHNTLTSATATLIQ